MKRKPVHIKTFTLIFIAALFVLANKLKRIQMSFKWRMAKQIMMYPYSGIVLHNKHKQLWIQH